MSTAPQRPTGPRAVPSRIPPRPTPEERIERLGLSSSREPIVRYQGTRWPVIKIAGGRA